MPGVMAFLAGSVCFYFFLATKSDPNEAWPGTGTLLFLLIPVVSWLAAVLWRSFNTAQWKIEVLQHVENAQQAFEIAIRKGMIYPPGSLLGSLEFQWAFQSEALATLEPRLAELQLKPATKKRKARVDHQIGYSMKVAATDTVYFLAIMAFLAYRTVVDFDTYRPVFYLAFLVFFLLYNRSALMRWVSRIAKSAPIQLDRTTLKLEGYEPVPWQQITQIFTEPNHAIDSIGNLLVVETNVPPYRMELDLSDIAGTDEETVQLILDYWEVGKTEPLKKETEKYFR